MKEIKDMITNNIGTITISKELEEFIIPLTKEEYFQLKKNILSEGCRDPLAVWVHNKKTILIDGHNRYKICNAHNIKFNIITKDFHNIEEVKQWMVDNQLGRRNLNPDQLSYYRGIKYLSLRKSHGGFENVKSKGQNELSTSELLADQFKVSESTIKRDAKFTEGLNIIGKSNPVLKKKILLGEVKVKKSDIQILSDLKDSDKIIIRNEADLYNKSKQIRSAILDEVEEKIKKIEEAKVESSGKLLNASEPIFLEKDDRLRKIKGRILSAINKAINERNVEAIKELKKLIEMLENELFNE